MDDIELIEQAEMTVPEDHPIRGSDRYGPDARWMRRWTMNSEGHPVCIEDALDTHTATFEEITIVQDANMALRTELGITLTSEQTPEPANVPLPALSRRQLLLGMAQAGLITMEEAIAAAQVGQVPNAIEAIFVTLVEPDQSAARVTWAAMSQAVRSDPLVDMLAAGRGIDPKTLDDLWVKWGYI